MYSSYREIPAPFKLGYTHCVRIQVVLVIGTVCFNTSDKCLKEEDPATEVKDTSSDGTCFCRLPDLKCDQLRNYCCQHFSCFARHLDLLRITWNVSYFRRWLDPASSSSARFIKHKNVNLNRFIPSSEAIISILVLTASSPLAIVSKYRSTYAFYVMIVFPCVLILSSGTAEILDREYRTILLENRDEQQA